MKFIVVVAKYTEIHIMLPEIKGKNTNCCLSCCKESQ